MTLFCIFHQFLNILFGIETVTCQFRIGFNPDTPTLVVGQMKLQHIEFIFHHLVNIEFKLIDRKEITSRVEHQRTVTKTRAVVDFNGRDSLLLRSTYITSQHLIQGHQSIEHSCCRSPFNFQSFIIHAQFVMVVFFQ